MEKDRGGPGAGGMVAFLGPSLPAEEARRIVPEVIVLPPVCQGDLTSAVRNLAPRAILVVDGEFSQALAVWHKEVLNALDAGIRVLGASSMGALRAAELDRYGMEGVGEIYAYYRDGWLTADADVALLHGDHEEGFRAYSWPMVNVRATVDVLAAGHEIDTAESQEVLTAAGRLHFSERTSLTLERELARSGVAPTRAGDLAKLVEERYVDQKAADARSGFEMLARLDEIHRPDRERPRHLSGRGYAALEYADVLLHRRSGSIRGYQLVDDVALHDPGFEQLIERALDRYLVVNMANDLAQQPSAEELETARTRLLKRWGTTEDDLPHLMADTELDEERLATLVRHQALLARMRRWMLDGLALQRNRRMVVEQLQLEGRFAAAADAAARRRTWADFRPEPRQPTTVAEVAELVAHQRAITGWSPSTYLAQLADEQGFDSLSGLHLALADARAAAEEQRLRRARVADVLGVDGPRRESPGPAQRMHALLESHQVTHVLLAAVELGLPGAIAAGPADTATVAGRLGLDAGRVGRMLTALGSLGVARSVDGRWCLTEMGEYLVPDPEDGTSLAPYAVHIRNELFATWAGLADAVRHGGTPPYPTGREADLHIDSAAGALGLDDLVAQAVDVQAVVHVADIGGGLGRTAQLMVERNPALHVTVVELPDTAERVAQRLAAVDGSDRLSVVAYTGQTALEPPVEVCVIVRVLLGLDDDGVVRVLELARRSLAPGGRMEVFEPEADGTPAAALSDLLNLVRSGGCVRSPHQWRALAQRAGLRTERRRPFVPPFFHYTFVPEGAP